ncbi:glucose PTS transporter transcription antiterminator GlcT [Mammaliicoccus stepanovicii]|uniref:Transcriptional antiterminator n=1 Tax=Mammaliicoccus stepanovicii TaxID=643214 RepID=A0A239ZC79_9STAP|nr:PRD domain-containing protein [Mammaliicoccus stepanovicii]PNZ74992.1 transcriptional antiterminator [Mammaliicoccus stepanovicii]GGI42038.1 PtsGHI operon antiterminator [Mammaliicoccus stepanovicii]SNV68755.1 transcriptional antiterminator [Mammaliicoccus stepanovicii]
MGKYVIEKTLNNNVLVANYYEKEVILIGKGISFGKKQGDVINTDLIEKIYLLESERDKDKYRQLLDDTNEYVFNAVLEVVNGIDRQLGGSVSEKTLISLTDHIIFAIKRIKEDIHVHNPFLKETELLYPREYKIAETAVKALNEKLDLQFIESEAGFIALHIHSAEVNHTIHDIYNIKEIIQNAIIIIEEDLEVTIDKNSINYSRFVRHLHFAIQRVLADERIPDATNIETLLKAQYPLCYNISIKIVKMMQSQLKKPIYQSELAYLTMHIQHFNNNL